MRNFNNPGDRQAPPVNPAIHELRSYIDAQRNKYAFIGEIGSGAVPNNGSLPIQITISEEADYLIEFFTAVAYGPTDANGIPITLSGTARIPATDFPLDPNANIKQAARGLTVQISDLGGQAKPLTSGYVPVEIIGTPGYSTQFQFPFKFKYLVKRNSKLLLDFRNRDSQSMSGGSVPVAQYHYVAFCFTGEKFVTPA